MKNKRRLMLSIAILMQFFILTGMLFLSALPLWTGQEIKLKTEPVDPRSLFRGNYATLKYGIGRIDIDQVRTTETAKLKKRVRQDEVIYVSLKADQKGIYHFSSASFNKPKHGVFLRGRVTRYRYTEQYHIKYGIEAFFAPKEKALALEHDLRGGDGIAVIMVSSNGQARLKEVVKNTAADNS